jgi:hypothetical protein
MCFFASHTTADAQQVKADTSGIAIGGSVSSSTINIGIPQEKVDELVREAKRPLEELTTQQRENIVLLKEKLDLNERQVRAALGILGETIFPRSGWRPSLSKLPSASKPFRKRHRFRPATIPKSLP